MMKRKKALAVRELAIPTPSENRKIVAAARRDPDAQPLTQCVLQKLRPRTAARVRVVSSR
jgi:hypothetical protein